jgi:hypothetical protein
MEYISQSVSAIVRFETCPISKSIQPIKFIDKSKLTTVDDDTNLNPEKEIVPEKSKLIAVDDDTNLNPEKEIVPIWSYCPKGPPKDVFKNLQTSEPSQQFNLHLQTSTSDNFFAKVAQESFESLPQSNFTSTTSTTSNDISKLPKTDSIVVSAQFDSNSTSHNFFAQEIISVNQEKCNNDNLQLLQIPQSDSPLTTSTSDNFFGKKIPAKDDLFETIAPSIEQYPIDKNAQIVNDSQTYKCECAIQETKELKARIYELECLLRNPYKNVEPIEPSFNIRTHTIVFVAGVVSWYIYFLF